MGLSPGSLKYLLVLTRMSNFETINTTVMCCIVNGPGESKAENIGISLPGNGEDPVCPVFVDGEKYASYSGTKDELANQFRLLLEEYVGRKYSRK